MAGNLPVPFGVELKLTWHVGASPYALNIFHFSNPQNFVIDQAAVNAWDTAIKSAFTSSTHAAGCHTTFSLHHVSARSMVANSNPWFDGTGPATPGTGAGNPLPAATSFVVTLRTGLRGRSYNGRCYLTGYTEDVNDAAGGITAAGSTNSLSFVNGALAVLSAAPYNMTACILSRFTTIPPATTPTERNPPILTPITAVLARDLRWDVQRRRAEPGI